MEFYRNFINSTTDFNESYMNYIYNQFNTFGFTKRDGSDLIWTNDENAYFRWGKDTNNIIHFYYPIRDSQLNRIYLQTYNGSIGSFCDFGSSYPGRTIIFIPLKNNNFILQQYSPRGAYELTSPFIVPYRWTNYSNTNNNFNTILRTVLSFKDNANIFSPYYYMTAWYGYSGGYIQPVIPSFYSSTGGSISNIINYIDTYYSSKNYKNINQNVCSLARIPVANGFFDGLYLCTTYPCDKIEGKVFSFNGRSFLGVFENLVVELPAN